VSIIVEFFAAADDTSSALALQSGPGRAFESLSFDNFDPEEAVIEWECLLAGGSFEELIKAAGGAVAVRTGGPDGDRIWWGRG
jgi:hypothetical protein